MGTIFVLLAIYITDPLWIHLFMGIIGIGFASCDFLLFLSFIIDDDRLALRYHRNRKKLSKINKKQNNTNNTNNTQNKTNKENT